MRRVTTIAHAVAVTLALVALSAPRPALACDADKCHGKSADCATGGKKCHHKGCKNGKCKHPGAKAKSAAPATEVNPPAAGSDGK